MGPQYQIAKCVICFRSWWKCSPNTAFSRDESEQMKPGFSLSLAVWFAFVCLRDKIFSSMDGKLDSGRQAHEGQYFCCNRKRTNGKLSKHNRLPIPFCISLVSWLNKPNTQATGEWKFDYPRPTCTTLESEMFHCPSRLLFRPLPSFSVAIFQPLLLYYWLTQNRCWFRCPEEYLDREFIRGLMHIVQS